MARRLINGVVTVLALTPVFIFIYAFIMMASDAMSPNEMRAYASTMEKGFIITSNDPAVIDRGFDKTFDEMRNQTLVQQIRLYAGIGINPTWTFPVPFADTNYSVVLTVQGGAGTSSDFRLYKILSKTATNCVFSHPGTPDTVTVDLIAAGFRQ